MVRSVSAVTGHRRARQRGVAAPFCAGGAGGWVFRRHHRPWSGGGCLVGWLWVEFLGEGVDGVEDSSSGGADQFGVCFGPFGYVADAVAGRVESEEASQYVSD